MNYLVPVPAIEVATPEMGGHQRVPVVLAIDTSLSMEGERMKGLNQSLQSFVDMVRNSETVSTHGVFKLIAFGNSGIQETDWVHGEHLALPALTAGGNTPMGGAMRRALQEIEDLKAMLRAQGIPYFRPWVFLLSDGEPNDEGWQAAAAECKQACQDKSVFIWPIGIPPNADVDALKSFCRDDVQTYMAGKNNDFTAIFEWLFSSIGIASGSGGKGIQVEAPRDRYEMS
jgi:uncharacterized protein YegL